MFHQPIAQKPQCCVTQLAEGSLVTYIGIQAICVRSNLSITRPQIPRCAKQLSRFRGIETFSLLGNLSASGNTRGIASILLTLISADVTAACVFLVGTGHSTLVGSEQMTLAVSAACRIAGINGWAAWEKRHRLRWATIILQRTKQRIDVVHIARPVEIAAAITAEVVTMGGQ